MSSAYASSFLSAIETQARRVPDKTAFCNSRGDRISFAQLKRQSDALARWLAANDRVPAGTPIVVYGHKSPLMMACFLACAKSGHAYVPVDVVYPCDRVASIVEQLSPTAALDTIGAMPELLGEGADLPCPCFGPAEFSQAWRAEKERAVQAGVGSTDASSNIGAAAGESAGAAPGSAPNSASGAAASEPGKPADAGESTAAAFAPVGKDDAFYILFTSGSTGTPKGVEVTTECVDRFSEWMLEGDFAVDEPRVWFNRSPFTFDVSLTDMAAGLTRGDTMFALEDEADKSLALAFEALGESDVTDWVSTPSYVEQCLADPAFSADLMPRLSRMLLAGEVLRPETVRLAQQRFPGLRVFNGYGPTESTDLVSLCEITPALLEGDRALPIGYAKPGTRLLVLDPETLAPVADGEHGELFIAGDTVAKGYWRRDDLTRVAFGTCPPELAGGMRSYRTGDEVTRAADGLFYYHGRYDLQVKLHGYRIELGDIESSLCALPEVHMACVLPCMRDGAIAHLTAFVVLAGSQGAGEPQGAPDAPGAPNTPDAPAAPLKPGFALTKRLKRALRQAIPAYMVPHSFKYVESFPLNPSGKADRKALAALLQD